MLDEGAEDFSAKILKADLRSHRIRFIRDKHTNTKTCRYTLAGFCVHIRLGVPRNMG